MNKRKLPNIVPILILTLITVIMWVSFDIYRALKKPTDAVVPPEVSQPLTPTLDQNSLNQVESHIYLNDTQIPDSLTGTSPAPKALVTPIPTLSPVNASGSGTTQ